MSRKKELRGRNEVLQVQIGGEEVQGGSKAEALGFHHRSSCNRGNLRGGIRGRRSCKKVPTRRGNLLLTSSIILQSNKSEHLLEGL